jgi:anthranilate/para-aminobenzoate synthase component I
MSKSEKITEEQLKEIQKIVSTTNQIKLEIGNVEARKYMLLNELSSVNKMMSDVSAKLEEEYGKMDIDINTGEITYPDEE